MKKIWYLALALVLLSACKTSKDSLVGKNEVLLDEMKVVGKKYPYRAAAERINDLLHTSLKVSFDWKKQHLFGEATLTLSPYFYPTKELVLDAKGMDINKISLVGGGDLAYEYNGSQLVIALDKTYKRGEEYSVYLNYVSKPNELTKASGLVAITDDKGLYFINPLGEEKDKPMQIWTQGEPESNSVWFPTIDKPNERCTQEITMTVENKFLAMSNGYLVSDIDNGDGTHSVTWKQDKAHAPYLFMMAIGEFAQIKDEWNGMSVDYFVEKEYENVAREIFGETPAMLSYFSEVLGVNYEWDKYWQVCVRDYVSGAMENTSAVIFGEFVQRDARELLDEDHEDIVSHELFHHWFGDLVTCESWANLPLNESFATYGEVMWREHRYGDNEKLRKVYEDMQGYFAEAASGKQVDMIRYHHDTAEDMFDGHSYAKGGTILNMLREVVGDEAFFLSLKTYLEDNKFQSVEIHNLRLAFEKVTGRDLNWFFDQWFLSAGHPILSIDYEYTENSVVVKMRQEASVEDALVYTLPFRIDVYEGNNVTGYDVIFHQKEQSFEFPTKTKPLWVNVDAEKSLLAEIANNQSEDNWIFQFMNGKNLLDKYYALEYLVNIEEPSDKVVDALRFALKDDYWYIQELAAASYPIDENDKEAIASLKYLAENASKTDVRAAAIITLSLLEDDELEAIYVKALDHPSYRVNSAALEAIMYSNPELSLKKAEEWENIENYELIDAIGYIYSEIGGEEKASYFEKMAKSEEEYDRYYGVYYYSMFLARMSPSLAQDGIAFIEKFGLNDKGDYSKNVAKSSLRRIKMAFEGQAEAMKMEMGSTGLSKAQKLALEAEMLDYMNVADIAQEAIAHIGE
ncbi:MAG: M1 family peptidase [Chitinophagales bacterium]|nr:M1 family peptidase [Chitinophagales bacterium]